MSIYDFQDYKEFYRRWLETQPSRGRGVGRRMALHLTTSSTLISQIFNGDRHLNLEMATEVAEFLSLTERETDYFYLLIQYARAGSKKLERNLRRRIEAAQNDARKVSERVIKDKELSEQEKSIYYSNWLYAGVRNIIATREVKTPDSIAERLHVPRQRILGVLEFLLAHGLISESKDGYEYLLKRTHISADHPLVHQHHKNWRLKGLEKMLAEPEANLFYSGPMSLSQADAERIRNKLLELLKEVTQIVGESDSETVRCLNIDWFDF